MKADPSQTYGYLAEFNDTDALVHAAQALTDKGYRKVEAYSSIPIEGLSAALGFPRTKLAWLVAMGGATGLTVGFSMQYWISVIAYPINIGGRPFNSWPAFIPVTFECMILFSVLTTVFGMLLLNGLPRLHHPIFAVPEFARASTDGLFIEIQSTDPLFDLDETKKLLEELHAKEVIHVPSAT
ncbi:DUF3341 domain-containing protein [Planctomicrobium sp. SH668]|uniref:DUF3341 domain-containing protein n=1 Tax=Planctomicrobium sp. SH668 TaxID=3448126 RepID=UPI003F5B6675